MFTFPFMAQSKDIPEEIRTGRDSTWRERERGGGRKKMLCHSSLSDSSAKLSLILLVFVLAFEISQFVLQILLFYF